MQDFPVASVHEVLQLIRYVTATNRPVVYRGSWEGLQESYARKYVQTLAQGERLCNGGGRFLGIPENDTRSCYHPALFERADVFDHSLDLVSLVHRIEDVLTGILNGKANARASSVSHSSDKRDVFSPEKISARNRTPPHTKRQRLQLGDHPLYAGDIGKSQLIAELDTGGIVVVIQTLELFRDSIL